MVSVKYIQLLAPPTWASNLNTIFSLHCAVQTDRHLLTFYLVVLRFECLVCVAC